MSAKNIYILFLLVTTAPVSIINFDAYLMGNQPSLLQALSSLCFVVLWLALGIYMGRKREASFPRFATLYGGIGAVLFVAGYLMEWQMMTILAVIIFTGPLYGLRYFLGIPADILLAVLGIGIAYVASMLGYFIGKKQSKPSRIS